MNRFCCTSYNRYCNVALATIAFILVCLIDVKTAQTVQTNDTDVVVANMTSIPSASTIVDEHSIEHPINLTSNTTTIIMQQQLQQQQQTTSQVLLSTSIDIPPTISSLPLEQPTKVAVVEEEQSNFVTSAAQPLVMTTVNSTTFNDNEVATTTTTTTSTITNKSSTPLSLLLTTNLTMMTTSTNGTTTSEAMQEHTSSGNDNNNNNKSSSSSSVSTKEEENVSTSSMERTTTFRPLIIPILPALRPRVVNQRPYSKHHHDHHWGPFFEEPLNGTSDNGALQVGFHLGTEAILNCRVGMLKDKTVMWIQRTTDKVSLLTVGNVTYSGDPRIGVKFQYPNNWRLHINPIKQEDAGLYMCQVSTHPPKVFATNLTVLAPAIRVVDEMGHDVNDRYYKLGSLIDISCQVAVSYLATLPPVPSENAKGQSSGKSVAAGNLIDGDSKKTDVDGKMLKDRGPHYLNHKIEWKKDGESLPGDVKISLSTSKNWKNSRLTILHAYQSHSGMYSCSVFNTSTAAAHVQVLNGETPAAVQHNSGCGVFVVKSVQNTQIKFLSSLFLLLFTTFYTSISGRTSLTTSILVTISELMFVV